MLVAHLPQWVKYGNGLKYGVNVLIIGLADQYSLVLVTIAGANVLLSPNAKEEWA